MMNANDGLKAAISALNDEQRQAVEYMDGPLLVIAGPGTGKTQLLSLRAANILANRDAAPENILCLTYTDAGAEAMRKRLVELVGRDAYGMQVSTFHGFARSVRARYPGSFSRPASDRLITDLHKAEIMDGILKRLPYGSPLAGIDQHGIARNVAEMIAFVSNAKRSGMSYEGLSLIARQNIEAAEWLKSNSELCALASMKASERVAQDFEMEVERSCASAPDELSREIAEATGVYVPFLKHFRDVVRRTDLVDEDGKTSGYQSVRDLYFGGSNKTGRYFKVKECSEKLAIACDVACRYQEALDSLHLYDYDDMIRDFVQAVEGDPALRQRLQDIYMYIQVDEFQDTNGAQMRIVDLLCDGVDSPNVMAVGDDDQAIMRFQGASIECVSQFVERYSPRTIVLRTNYRSTPAIVELGQKVASQVERRLASGGEKVIEAFRPQGDQISFDETVCRSKAEEYAAVAADVKLRIASGYRETCKKPDEAIAIIAAKHASLRALIPYLIAEGVPFSYRQTQDLFTSERMQTMLALIRCVAALSQGRAEVAESCLPQIIAAPEFGGDHESSVHFALTARREHHGSWLEAMRRSGDGRIKRIHDDLTQWAAEAPASPVRELLFRMAQRPLAYYRRVSEQDSLAFAEFNAGMRALLGFVQGELDASAGHDRALRLADVAERLDAACRHEVNIEAGIDLGEPGAVRLVTAHASKGLEFDCVYLLDADDATWHRGASGAGIYPSNLLIGDERDEDDARRLLFVALTRAKRHLEVYRSGGAQLRELAGEIGSHEIEFCPEALGAAIETDWHASYRLDTPELAALANPCKDVRCLSASALNSFVTYETGCANSALFPERQVMQLPKAPQIQLEFGTLVHAMLQDIVNFAMGRNEGAAGIMGAHRERVAWMDFPEQDVERCLIRYDRICESFVPWLMREGAAGFRRVTEAKVEAVTEAGTPLLGFLDLLLVDDKARTVRIVDYKTGANYEAPSGYERQLRFYKLLVERAPEFEGYTVVSMGDFYVEPEKDSGALHPPFELHATEEEIYELERLADAVWRRIQNGDWNTSAFEQSELYERAATEQRSLRARRDKERVMQKAYEEWLMGC